MNQVETPPAGEAPAPAAASERQPAASRGRQRLGSLAWQGVIGLLALFSLIFMGIALVMNTYGRQQVAEQSAGKLEEAGRRRVEEVRRWLAGVRPLDPSHPQRLSQAWQAEASGYAFLLDGDQRFLSFPRPELVGLTSRGEAGATARARLTAGEVADRHPGFRPIADALGRLPADGGTAAPVRVPIRVELPADLLNGEPSLALIFPVPETDWTLVQVSPRGELEQAAGRISRSLLLLISGILLAVLLPSYLFLSRRWITPVTTLAEAATLVRDGELDVRVSMPGRDEIGVLADSFNQMVDQLEANTAGLKQANVELGRSLGLTDTIMGAVREGLFLLTPELTIEARYSAATRRIFGQEELAGADFLDLIRQITPERTHELTARFLRLVFNPAKTDSVVAKINPLKEVEASFPSRSGQLEQKFLTFTFERIREGGEIRHAMVTVADVTPRVLLAQQLKQSQQRMERQAELLLSVMHVEPQTLRQFIEDAHTELESINTLLREGRSAVLSTPDRNTYYRYLVEDIFKSVHTIKGTASMLHIDYFAAAAHRFEEKLAALRGRTMLDGSDFVPIVLELSEMVDSLAEIRDVLARFAEAQRTLKAASSASDIEVLSALVSRFVDDLAEKSGKKVSGGVPRSRRPGDPVQIQERAPRRHGPAGPQLDRPRHRDPGRAAGGGQAGGGAHPGGGPAEQRQPRVPVQGRRPGHRLQAGGRAGAGAGQERALDPRAADRPRAEPVEIGSARSDDLPSRLLHRRPGDRRRRARRRHERRARRADQAGRADLAAAAEGPVLRVPHRAAQRGVESCRGPAANC